MSSIRLLGKSLWNYVPSAIQDIVLRQIGPVSRQLLSSRHHAESLYGGPLPTHSTYMGRYPITIGVFKDRSSMYTYNIMACRDLGVPFKVLDLERSDWLQQVRENPCDAYMVWPSASISIWKDIYDERLPLLAMATGKPVVPTPTEIWLWESKRRMRDWLISHDVPAPTTEVFYDKAEASSYAQNCTLPIVLKTNNGSCSHGVYVIRSREKLCGLINKAFGAGIPKRRGDKHDNTWGYVILQKHIPHDYEWRIIRVGESFICRRKVRIGDYASASGNIDWATPEIELLEFAWEVTTKGGFQNMAIDVFVDVNSSEGTRYLVNEMQCLVGAKPLPEHPARGRWLRSDDGQWNFEAGEFCSNACANLRLACLLNSLGAKSSDQSAQD